MSSGPQGSRRVYGATVVAGIASGGGLFLAAARPWGKVDVAVSGMPVDPVAVTGAEASPAVSALALVVMAGSVAVLAGSRRLRRVIGAIIAVAAMVAGVLAITAGAAVDSGLAEAVAASPSMTGDETTQAALLAGAESTGWRWVSVALAVVSTVIGLLVVVLGPRWPVMGSRYEAPVVGGSGSRPVASRRRDDGTDPDDADLWKALDEGEDPTV